MIIPSPEELQMLLGVHPSQQFANQALLGGGQGDQPASDAVAPASQPAPTAKTDEAPVEIPQRPSLIGRPSVRGLDVPPVGTPGPDNAPGTVVTGVDAAGRPALGPDTGQPVGYVPPAPKVAAPPPSPVDMSGISGLMTQPIRPISGDQNREQKDQAELDRLRTTGSGVSQFQKRHKYWGGLVRGLDIAGAAIAPGVSQMVPGTELHHKELVGEARGRVAQDIGDEKAHQAMQTSEEAQQARIEANRIREESLQDKISQANQKFVAGSEHEDPNSTTGWSAQTVGGEWKPYTPPSDHKQTKGESFEDIQGRRGKEADNLGLTGEKRTFYLANGKLHEPGTPAAGAQEYTEWKAAFSRDHGREPSAEEIAAYKHGGGAAGHPKDMRTAHSAVEKDKQVQITSEANRFKKEWNQAYKDKTTDKDTLDNLKAEHQARMDSIQSSYEQRIQELASEHQTGAPAGPAPVGNEPLPQPIASVRTGEPVPPAKPAKPSPSTPQKPAGGTPSPTTHSFSVSAWAAKHPNQDVNAARAAAKAQGFKVID